MRLFLLLLCLYTRADWKTDARWYFWNNTQPGVALTSTIIHGCEHASGSVTSVQIGDYTGILPAYCTAFVNCPTSIQNCEWTRTSKNETNDAMLFIACRPVTNGIAYIATNYTTGTPVTWFSINSQAWVDTTINTVINQHSATFLDLTTAWMGTLVVNGPPPVSGDSGSPVFTMDGDFVGNITAIGGGGTGVVNWAYPSGSSYRPAVFPSSIGSAGLSGLFNSDPDR